MARVLAVPIEIWHRLHKLSMHHADLFADADNQGTRSAAILSGRREKSLAQAELIGADVWNFVQGSEPKAIHYFFVAKDEQELEAKVVLLEVMSV